MWKCLRWTLTPFCSLWCGFKKSSALFGVMPSQWLWIHAFSNNVLYFQDLQDLMDPSRNMSKYRNLVNSDIVQPPLVGIWSDKDRVPMVMENPGKSWKKLLSWKVMEKSWNMKISQKIMEKSWNCLFSWLWQLSSLWLSCMLWDAIITISETMWEWESWKEVNQSWKSHGILFSDFCGNPERVDTLTNSVGFNNMIIYIIIWGFVMQLFFLLFNFRFHSSLLSRRIWPSFTLEMTQRLMVLWTLRSCEWLPRRSATPATWPLLNTWATFWNAESKHHLSFISQLSVSHHCNVTNLWKKKRKKPLSPRIWTASTSVMAAPMPSSRHLLVQMPLQLPRCDASDAARPSLTPRRCMRRWDWYSCVVDLSWSWECENLLVIVWTCAFSFAGTDGSTSQILPPKHEGDQWWSTADRDVQPVRTSRYQTKCCLALCRNFHFPMLCMHWLCMLDSTVVWGRLAQHSESTRFTLWPSFGKPKLNTILLQTRKCSWLLKVGSFLLWKDFTIGKTFWVFFFGAVPQSSIPNVLSQEAQAAVIGQYSQPINKPAL